MRNERLLSDAAACPADGKSKQTVRPSESEECQLPVSSWEVSAAATKLKEALLLLLHRLRLQVN